MVYHSVCTGQYEIALTLPTILSVIVFVITLYRKRTLSKKVFTTLLIICILGSFISSVSYNECVELSSQRKIEFVGVKLLPSYITNLFSNIN